MDRGEDRPVCGEQAQDGLGKSTLQVKVIRDAVINCSAARHVENAGRLRASSEDAFE
jgi:hypothetical protein